MIQSRLHSAIEAAVNVAVGWLVALAAQLVLFPALGLQAQLWQHFWLSVGFTLVSLLRSYALRRLFARWT